MTNAGGMTSDKPTAAKVRANWRELPVIDLTDAEVALMSKREERWCHDLLADRHRLKNAPPVAPPAPLNIDAAKVAIMDSGARILVYPGEGADSRTFGGELLNPTARERRGNGHISCLWDRSKVVALEGAA